MSCFVALGHELANACDTVVSKNAMRCEATVRMIWPVFL
jgi:hypothetical protein